MYKFPRRVVERGQSSLLNDIVVDVDTQIGYISNSMKGEIVVYNSIRGKSWTVQKKPEMFADPKVSFFKDFLGIGTLSSTKISLIFL